MGDVVCNFVDPVNLSQRDIAASDRFPSRSVLLAGKSWVHTVVVFELIDCHRFIANIVNTTPETWLPSYSEVGAVAWSAPRREIPQVSSVA